MAASTPADGRGPEAVAARASGAPAFIAGCLALGTIGVFVTEAGAHPLTATWFRCAFGLLGLSLWLQLRKETASLRLSRASWPVVLASAVLMVLAWGLSFASIARTSASIATVLAQFQPMWMLLIAMCWLKERIARRRVVFVMVAMVGLVLATGMLNEVSSQGAPAGRVFGAGYWLGVAFSLTSALCTACVALIAQRLGRLPAGVLAWWQCAIGTLVLFTWPILNGWPAWGQSWVWLSGLGLIHTGLAYGLMYAGMARLRTDRIAVLQFIYPATVIVLDWLVYGHRLEGLQMLGVGIMAVAIWCAGRRSNQARPTQRVTKAGP